MSAEPRGQVWVIGYGSLLSERSARMTFPNLTQFQVGTLRGYRRVFCHAPPVFIRRGVADLSTGERGSLSVERVDDTESAFHRVGILVSLFAVGEDELPGFYKREEEYEIVREVAEGAGGAGVVDGGLLCLRSSDEAYRRKLGSDAAWEEKVASLGVDKVWTDNVLPSRVYLRHCWLAAKRLGPQVLDSFLDTTFLSDRTTSMRTYLDKNPTILTESLAPQYGNYFTD